MHVRYMLSWDAEEEGGRYVPRIFITDLTTQLPALQWRATYSLDTYSGALLHAHDYGEVALQALNALTCSSAAEAPPMP